MGWKIEDAQQQFLEVINAEGQAPQLIYQHNHLVAAVIRANLFQEFLEWQQKQQPSSLADAFAELRQLCLEENYILESTPRCDRPVILDLQERGELWEDFYDVLASHSRAQEETISWDDLEYEQLLEDLHNLAVVAERRSEQPISATEMKKRLNRDETL